MPEVISPTSPQTATPGKGTRFVNHLVFKGAMLMLLVLLVYWPSYRAGFIWDDELMTRNPLVKGGWAGLRDIWFSTKFVDYLPLTLTSFWLEWHLWEMGESGYHVTNVLLHAVGVVLLWRVLSRLKIPGAWMAAAIFAVHPVCVASVTWVAERKNTLSLVFYLLSLLLYFQFENANRDSEESRSICSHAILGSRPVRYFLSLVAFVLGLCSKTSIVVLPVILLLCAWWQRGRISRRDLGRAVPFFVVAFAFGLMTIFIHHRFDAGKLVELTTDNLLVRSLGGSWAVWFYLGKALWPVNLTMQYARWEIDPRSWLSYIPALLILASLGLFWLCRRTWGRACFFAFGYFILALAPALGVINMAFLTLSRVADHFQYLALPGIIALLVAATASGWNTLIAQRIPLLSARIFAAATLGLLSALTWRHERIVGEAEKLWRDNLVKNPSSWVAHNNLGRILFSQGKFNEAEKHCAAALSIATSSASAEVHYNLGSALYYQGKIDDAIAALSTAVRLAPEDSKSRNNLANALLQKGRIDEAIAHFKEAIRLDPDNLEARISFAHTLVGKGEMHQAIEQFTEALRLNPNSWAAHNDVARLLASDGKLDEALPHFQRAAVLQPDSPEVQANLANVFALQEKLDDAALHYSEAVRLTPQNTLVRIRFADILARQGKKSDAADQYFLAHWMESGTLTQQGKIAEAIEQLREALKWKPDAPEILNNLAWLLAVSADSKLRNGPEAVRLAERASAVSEQKSYPFLSTLAAAYAEAGRFPEAVSTTERAIALAQSAKDTNSAARYLSRLDLYRQQRPYREPAAQ